MHLDELPSGRWRATVRYKGARRYASGRTRADAQFAGAQLLIEMGGTPRQSGMSVGAVVAGYIDEKTGSWSPSTLADRVAAVKLIPTVFLDRPAESVTVPIVLGLWRQMAAAGVSPHRCRSSSGPLSPLAQC